MKALHQKILKNRDKFFKYIFDTNKYILILETNLENNILIRNVRMLSLKK